jgi:hypothetical protein
MSVPLSTYRAVSSSKRKRAKKAKSREVKAETFKWRGCIAVRGKGKNREYLLVWEDDNLIESHWIAFDAITGLPDDGLVPHLLVLQKLNDNADWKDLHVKHPDLVDVLTQVSKEVDEIRESEDPDSVPRVAERAVSVPKLPCKISIEHKLDAEFKVDGCGTLRWTLVKITAAAKAKGAASSMSVAAVAGTGADAAYDGDDAACCCCRVCVRVCSLLCCF